jgi:uncharacterized protein YjbJ (UPF0337 family)
MTDETGENIKGTLKEVAGKATGSDERANEGQAQHEKAEHEEKAEKHEEKAEEAEREQAKHQGN